MNKQKWITELNHRINEAKGDYEDFIDLSLKDAVELLALLKEQEAVVRCKDCKHATMTADGELCKYCENDTDDDGNQREVYHSAYWFCADGVKKE